MAAGSVVEAFDISKDITFSFLPCCVLLMVDQFRLEGMEEALHWGVVVTIGLAAHRGGDVSRRHRLAGSRPRHIERRDLNDGSGRHWAAVQRWPSARLPMAVQCANDLPSPKPTILRLKRSMTAAR